MPPRYAYWTIIVDNQPTAFRSGSQEELMPTFKRLKAKNDTAVMMWWQSGKLWPSRVAAQEAMLARTEMGRRGPSTYSKAPADREAFKTSRAPRTAWTPRGEPSTPPPARNPDQKLDWKPKGEFVPAPKRSDRPDWKSNRSEAESRGPRRSAEREGAPARSEWKPKERPEWRPKSNSSEAEGRAPRRSAEREGRPARSEWSPKTQDPRPRSFKRPDFKPSGDDTRSAKPEWKPKGSFTPAPRRSEGSDWKPKPSFDRERKPDWKPKSPRSGDDRRPGKLEWSPKGENPKTQDPGPRTPEKRKWVPKEEYKKSMGIEARRDSKWRPGGEHKDPKQKYKDAKKAKWTKFKQNIRARSGGKGKKSS
jgi:hypothetical protein